MNFKKAIIFFLSILLHFSMLSQDIKNDINFSNLKIVDLNIQIAQRKDEPKQFSLLTNKLGVNRMQSYSVRPEYTFPGKEVIYKLPNYEGGVYLEVQKRYPNIEVDLFLVTDPADPSTALLWLNGAGTKKYFEMDPGQDYYLVVDGFENSTAELEFALSPSLADLEVCATSTDTIYLDDLLTSCPPTSGSTWQRNMGSGGSFDPIGRTFVPFDPDSAMATTTTFHYALNFGTCCNEFVNVVINETCTCCSELTENEFDGSTNNQWSNPDNWSLNQVPNDCQNVVIPAGQTVEILADEYAICHDIDVSLSAQLIVSPDGVLHATACEE